MTTPTGNTPPDSVESTSADHRQAQKPHWLTSLIRLVSGQRSDDVIAAEVGADAQHVIVGKNIIQVGTLRIPISFALGFLVIVVVGVAGIGVIAKNTSPAPPPTITPLPTATPLAFATATPSETLILLATFHNTAATNAEAQKKIQRAIEAEAVKHVEQKLRVVVEPAELTADQRVQAEELGKRYNASMVIWGEDTGVQVIVNFLNLREPCFCASDITISETERTQLANSGAYAKFITDDLPGQLTFLALFAVGQAYYVNQDYPHAITAIRLAITSLKSDAPTGLADAYFRLGWLYQASSSKDLQQAIAMYDHAIQLDPSKTSSYYNRGLAFLILGQYQQALQAFDQVIELDPNDAMAYHNRGFALATLGQHEKALLAYDRAIKLDINDVNVYNNRGVTLAALGHYTEAVQAFDQAIKLNPNYADAYNNRGLSLNTLGRYEEALLAYNQAIKLHPNDANTYKNLGNAFFYLGRYEEALLAYNQAIKLNLNNASVHGYRGLVLAFLGRYEEALLDFDQVIKLNPNDVAAYNNRSNALAFLGRYEEVVQTLDQVIKLDPSDAMAYHNRGFALATLGKYEEALLDFRHYIELRPDARDRAKVEQRITEIETKLAKLK